MLHPTTASNVLVQVRDQEYGAAKTRYEERLREREVLVTQPKNGVDRTRDHGRRSVPVNPSVALSFCVTSRNPTDIHYVTNGYPGNSALTKEEGERNKRHIDVYDSELVSRINLLFVMTFMTVC